MRFPNGSIIILPAISYDGDILVGYRRQSAILSFISINRPGRCHSALPVPGMFRALYNSLGERLTSFARDEDEKPDFILISLENATDPPYLSEQRWVPIEDFARNFGRKVSFDAEELVVEISN